ncbi:MAG: hypothetical protein AB7T37_05705 [Dehalococcoidia bacterium]
MRQNALPGRGWFLAALAAVMIMLFAGASSLAAPTTAAAIPPAPPAYYPFGPQVDVDEATVTGGGWTLCYSGNYNGPSPTAAYLFAVCAGDYLLLAGRPVGDSAFEVLAAAPFADVTFDTDDSNTPHDANGSGWYYDDDVSWGFAREGDPINRSSCDDEDAPSTDGNDGGTGAYRLCWHMSSGYLWDGWRSGLSDELGGGVMTHDRFIYRYRAPVGPPPAYYPFGPQTSVEESVVTGGGWQLCYQTNYNDDETLPANNLTTVLSDCDGDYLLLAGRPVGSTAFEVLAAAPFDDVTAGIATGITPSGVGGINTPRDANGGGWYFDGNFSWGFAPSGHEIDRAECDVADSTSNGGDIGGTGAYRLCWHTLQGAIGSGWRSGLSDELQGGVTTHERFIYTYTATGIADGIAPEFVISFDPEEGGLVVEGVDDSGIESVVMSGGGLFRTYTITDNAANTTVVEMLALKFGFGRVFFVLQTVNYNEAGEQPIAGSGLYLGGQDRNGNIATMFAYLRGSEGGPVRALFNNGDTRIFAGGGSEFFPDDFNMPFLQSDGGETFATYLH